jgi:translation initiation factor IF-1
MAMKKKKPEYGNVVQATGNKLWDVKLDNGSTVVMKNQSINKVEAQIVIENVVYKTEFRKT